MLNSGLWASSKGMVKVPDLSGLTKTQAAAAIEAAHLVAVDGGSSDTSNSALDNKIASQLPNPNDLVSYESSVSYISYHYVSTPGPGPGPTAIIPTITNLAFTPNAERTGGTLSWSGTNVDVYLFTGNSATYPSPYNYGAYTATWPGNLVNMSVGSTYSMEVTVRSSTGNQASASINYTMPEVETPPTGVYYQFIYYDGKCNYVIYDSTNTQIGSYSTNYCTSRGASPYAGVALPGCDNPSCIQDTPTCTPSTTYSNYSGLQYGTCTNGSQTVTATLATRTVTASDCSTTVTENVSGSWSQGTQSCTSCTAGYTDWVYAGLTYGTCTSGTQTVTATTRSRSYRDTDCSLTPQPMESGSWAQPSQSCTPTACTCANASSISPSWSSCSGAMCSSGSTGTISQYTSYSTPCGFLFNTAGTGSFNWWCCASC